MIDLSRATTDAVAAAGPLVALLPIGATEAHGPHLPLATDVAIASELARAIAARSDATVRYATLPPIAYAPAESAANFAGTISIKPDTLRALVRDVAAELARHRFRALVIVNGHLEPDHVRNLRRAADDARASLATIAPEWTSARYRAHLPAEFFEGGAHAGGYETSLVLAADPSLVDERAARALAPNRQDLAALFKAGKKTFEEMPGGARVYFGDPASATREAGRAIYDALASAVDAEVRAALGAGAP